MKKTVLNSATLAIVVSAFAATGASAFERHRTVTGPYGGSAHFHAKGSCTSNSCARTATRTGPNGATFQRSGAATCANGVCSAARVTTLPSGQIVTRQGSIHR